MIIAFEGVDGSGKGTQSTKLSKYLTDKGVDNALISFPNYQGTYFGKEIGKYLNGAFGSKEDLPAEFPALLYAIDRYEMKKEIISVLNSNKIIIFDRYVSSNFAYQAAKLDKDKQADFINWVKTLEYEILGLPKADKVFFLDVPPAISYNLVLKKKKRDYTEEKQDIHEKDTSYISKVYDIYKNISQKDKWNIINCVENNNIINEDLIFSQILEYVPQFK